MPILTVIILTEQGQIGSLISYADQDEAAVADYLAARQSEGRRAVLFHSAASGEPACRLELEAETSQANVVCLSPANVMGLSPAELARAKEFLDTDRLVSNVCP